MPAANESQGLKIGIAACVALIVILGVSCYFLYDFGSTSVAKSEAAEKKQREAEKTQRTLLQQYNDLKAKVGLAVDDHEQLKDQLKKFDDSLTTKITELTATVDKMVKDAQAKGASSQELANLSQQSQKIKGDLLNELNKGAYVPTIDKMRELLANNTLLLTELGVAYQSLRGNLESANQVNADLMESESNEKKKAQELQLANLAEHDQKRQELLTAVDSYKTQNTNLATELAALKTDYRHFQDEKAKELETVTKQLKYFRDQFERTQDIVLDTPDGYITFANYDQRGNDTVRVTANRGHGAKEQMRFAVFDRNAPGIPNEKPKGTIELVSVGYKDSYAKIVDTKDSLNPIRTGDIIYSPAWSPNEPLRFALIGKLDINRDGKDDRMDVKRAIEGAGGIVEYDLPPPGKGKPAGKLTPAAAWYVIDERPPFYPPFMTKRSQGDTDNSETREYNKKAAEMVQQARQLGIRPLRLERLMSYLGYKPDSQMPGRLETINKKLRDSILHPEGLSPEAAKQELESAETGVSKGIETPMEAAPADKKEDKDDEDPQ